MNPSPGKRILPLALMAIFAVGLTALFSVFQSRRPAAPAPAAQAGDVFMESMNAGKNYLDRGEAAKAVEAFQRSAQASPAHPDAHLNLANAFLLAGQSEAAIQQAQEVLKLEANSPAALYVIGCANLRLNRPEEALKTLQQCRDMDPNLAAPNFQLGLAHSRLGHWEEAITALQAAADLEPEHPAAHYNLSQALIRAGREAEAAQELETHRQIAARLAGPPPGVAEFERSKYTAARVPFRLEQPASAGIAVKFTDATDAAFNAAGGGQAFAGPAGLVDIYHDSSWDLFVLEREKGFRLLINSNGVFQPLGEPVPALPGAIYTECLTGDMQNDRSEDVIMLGPEGSHLFKITTNGAITDVTTFSRLAGLKARDGALADMDFTGKLDLFAATATNSLRMFRNLGNLFFRDNTATSGLPAAVTTARQIVSEDWNNDDLMDLLIAREGQPPLLLLKQRGGPLVETNWPSALPAAEVVAAGDLNNDLRADLVLAAGSSIEILFNGLTNKASISLGAGKVAGLDLIDYDNDGWLDVCAWGESLRVWRNQGQAGFIETTAPLGLANLRGITQSLATADFDNDGDTDFLLSTTEGLKLLRNDGGNANQQMKIRLLGNRSNSSGLGVRVELASGGLRLIRTAQRLPLEIGVGQRQKLDSLTVRWFDLAVNSVDVEVAPRVPLTLAELVLPTGSCPYLYAWDGRGYRFVTDLLGAAPLGLPLAEGRYIEADPDEFAWVGDESNFQPLDGEYVLQITEELREVLYLDEAKLAVVDHLPGAVIHPTDKLLPGKPFPPSELVSLRPAARLVKATRHDGADVTGALQSWDQVMASPVSLRAPQLRGLAEQTAFTLEFDRIDTARPLALSLTGWLRFGGGMANVAASHHADFPFPFPTLEAEDAQGQWKAVDVSVGAPAGKTKTIFVDLQNKLPAGARRLRLTAAFEIHWDKIALMERGEEAQIATLAPSSAHLHWRGFSEFQDLPAHLPLSPDYAKVKARPSWKIMPSGWCTRYGAVDELVAREDGALALISGGDELTLRFPASRLPPKPEGHVRTFFLYTVGWDKDADFHVARGTTVEPMPFRGMDDQLYGTDLHPKPADDSWIKKYNTRWVGSLTFDREKLEVSHRASSARQKAD